MASHLKLFRRTLSLGFQLPSNQQQLFRQQRFQQRQQRRQSSTPIHARTSGASCPTQTQVPDRGASGVSICTFILYFYTSKASKVSTFCFARSSSRNLWSISACDVYLVSSFFLLSCNMYNMSSHYYMCVLLLLYMCPYTCVVILIGEPVERLSFFLVLKLSMNSTWSICCTGLRKWKESFTTGFLTSRVVKNYFDFLSPVQQIDLAIISQL